MQSATAGPRPVVGMEPVVGRGTETVVVVGATVVLVVGLVATTVLLLVVGVGAVFALSPPQPPPRAIREVNTMQGNRRTRAIAVILPLGAGRERPAVSSARR